MLQQVLAKRTFHGSSVVVNCDWSNWSRWTSCSKSCGGGIREKTRRVQTPARNGGVPCSGSGSQIESCNDQDCPGRILKQFQEII